MLAVARGSRTLYISSQGFVRGESAMRIRVLLVVLSLFCASWAVAQDDAKKSKTEQKASGSGQSDENKSLTYTKDHLREQVDESAKSSAIIYNENLAEKSAARGDTSVTVFTNDTLRQRFGPPEPWAAVTISQPTPDIAENTAEADEAPAAEPGMSSAERAERIAKIEGDLKRLERRTLAIRNPLLAGTVPPTDEERTNEQGMANPERLKGVESQIVELKVELQELQSGD